MRPDELKDLGVGEAYVWTPGGPGPERVRVAIAPQLVEQSPASTDPAYGESGPAALPKTDGTSSEESAKVLELDNERERRAASGVAAQEGEAEELRRQSLGRHRETEF